MNNDRRNRGSWIQTFTGRQFWPIDPSPDDVDINDIAHALSMQCRFTGHSRAFYSVAEHSVRVSHACDPKDALWGLLHDAAEAYLVDLAAPIKRQPELAGYSVLEKAIMGAVCARFHIDPKQPESVTRADLVLLATEKRDVMGPAPAEWMPLPDPLPERIETWTPSVAKMKFRDRFVELGGGA